MTSYHCTKCDSRSGFRGEQKTEHRRRTDGLMEMVAVGPEVIYCKTCGSEVKPETATPDKVLDGPPPHLDGDYLIDTDESE